MNAIKQHNKHDNKFLKSKPGFVPQILEDNFTENQIFFEKNDFDCIPELQVQALFPIYVPSRCQGNNVVHASVNRPVTSRRSLTDKQIVADSTEEINHFQFGSKSEISAHQISSVQNVQCDDNGSEFYVNVQSMGEDTMLFEDNLRCLTYVEKDVEFPSQQESALEFGIHFNALSASVSNANNNSIYISGPTLSETDMTNELASKKRSVEKIQNGGDAIERRTISYLCLAARASSKDKSYSDQSKGQTNKKKKPQPGGGLLKKELSSSNNDSTPCYNSLTGADKSVQLTVASSITTSASFMSPQDQSLLATPGSSCSPGHEMNSPPSSNTKISDNNFQSIDDRFPNSNDISKADSLEITTQIHPIYSNNQTMQLRNDRSNIDGDKYEAIQDTKENGGNSIERKISSDTIYPWMKESRQNQKKKQNTSVSSGKFLFKKKANKSLFAEII